MMPVHLARYRKLLLALGATFVGSELVVSFAFPPQPLSQAMAGLLFAPFLAPALGAAFVMHAWARPKEMRSTTGLGVLLAGLHAAAAHLLETNTRVASDLVYGVGLASLLVTGANAARTKDETRAEWLSLLLPGAVLPVFVLVSSFFLEMTTFLHPMVLDASVFAADVFFGRQPSFVVARAFAAAPALALVSRIVYWNLPLALAFVYGARRHSDPETSDDVLFSFVALGLFGFVLYHFYPVVGPAFFFAKDFPAEPAQLPDPAQAYLVRLPVPRNCVPSLHTAWALLVYWQARPLPRAVRWSAAAWLAFTALGTLGFGYHYAMDLVVAVPFTMAIRGLFATSWRGSEIGRWYVVALGACLTTGWFIALRLFLPGAPGGDGWRWAVAGLTVVSSFFLERHFDARAPIFHPTRADREGRALAALVFTAGAAYAAWYVSIAKSLAIAFGNAADVALATLAAGMAGIAAGSAIGAELATRRGHALRVLAFCLVVAALLGASTPWLISALPSLAVAVSVIVLPSAVMIGLALPSLVQYAARPNVGKAIAWLAVPALTGAALGAWLTGYIVLPFLGVGATTWIPVLANLCAGLVALRRSARAPAMAHDPISTLDRAASAHGRLPLSILAGGSLAAVGVATIDVHLLSAVATSSAYSCALIVSVLAVSTAAGTALARRGLQEPTLMYLATIELAFTMAVLVSAHVWNALPGYFASFAGYSLTRTFASRELVRFAVGSIMLVPPAFCIGTLFPAAMDVVARGSKSPERALGRATAAAMLGGLGGVGVALLLVARVGSLRALEATGAIAFLLGLAPLIRTRAPARGPVALAATFVVALFLVYPKDLDYVALSGGAHVHFEAAPTGRSIDHTESLESGIVTVSESNPAPGDRVLTLLSNGELSSNAFAEQSTLLNYARYPLLHTAARGDALVIGVGTSAAMTALRTAGFRHVDVVEPSEGVALLATRHFTDVQDPGVEVHRSDARPFLRRSSIRYDLLSVSPVRLWVAGSTSLHSREFYQLAKTRLSPEGVLELSLPLHYTSVEAVVSALETVHSEFAHVWVYAARSNASVVACNHDCGPTPATLKAAGDARRLIADRLLSPEAVDKLLAQVGERGIDIEQLVSTDDNLFLELDAPRGNIRDYERSFNSNVTLLRSFAPVSLLEGTRLSEEDLPLRSWD